MANETERETGTHFLERADEDEGISLNGKGNRMNNGH
jgi:hypothetical protein